MSDIKRELVEALIEMLESAEYTVGRSRVLDHKQYVVRTSEFKELKAALKRSKARTDSIASGRFTLWRNKS